MWPLVGKKKGDSDDVSSLTGREEVEAFNAALELKNRHERDARLTQLWENHGLNRDRPQFKL